ncbi:thiosulfate reductase PhsA [Desulfosporosinus nitroreducens]|uniref:thiosulfate reductase PhsA n=1 Tax=Desulfosporosinus nitroreducens TaxID=2018668 RepID=UPI00207C4F8C|nr:thiosulfate reductase PhsA [Desulfosporosinus nitroreducens]MCO1601883.1 thiosulfate reductase PhsA [Desulfosporosinus nitroreducens]
MKRRNFLKGVLYGTGATMALVGGFGTFNKLDSLKAEAIDKDLETNVFSSCEMCRNQCPIAVKVKDGKVVKIDGHPDDAAFGGVICARGNAGPSLLYDPQRIKKPMIRTGERGEGKFKEVSWDEAYTYISDKLYNVKDQYGGEAIALASRKGPHDWFFRSIGKALGSPNVFSHEATCPMTRSVALDTTFGNEAIAADYANTKYLISIGRNWFEGIHVAQTRAVSKALSNGAKLVVLDPRFSITASKGEWLPIKATTDLAFVMAMANILIQENLYDQNFISQYTEGFEKWAEEVKDKTPEWAEKETGISKDKIIQITREFAAAKPQAILDFGWRTAYTPNDYQLRRAILIVNMMIGNLEVPGGYYRTKPANFLKDFPDQAVHAKVLGNITQPSFPKASKGRIDGTGVKGTPGQIIPAYDGAVGKIVESILTEEPYPIRAWLVHRFNPYISLTESPRVLEAFKKLDLLVTCDVYMTDTAYFSDVVLPECTYLERYEPIFDMAGLTPKYVIRQPAVPLVYPDTKPYWQIYKELGEKMGLGDYFEFKDMEDFVTQQLRPTGITLDKMKEMGVWTPPGMNAFYVRANDAKASMDTVLSNHSKKIEIFSVDVEEATKQGVPKYVSHPQPEEGKFRFVQGKVAVHTNAGTANVPILNELMPTNTLWMNPISCTKLSLKDGDEIVISSGLNEHKGKIKMTEGIRPDTVFCYHGFGRVSPELKRAFGKGINDNHLIPNEIGEVGNTVTSTTFVTVRKA